ncbi:HNH endonuclease [Sinorhizobium fredii]|uniref:HNH endonuclease n=1 Tax=Rhizobium fredii TaxID=380 RepID=UPI0035151D40
MRPLNPIQRDHRDLYTSCISQTQDVDQRNRLTALTDRVVTAGEAYNTQLTAGRADVVAPIGLTDQERSDLKNLYGYRLASQQGIERRTYEAIKTLTGDCPYCGFGEVWEVDHYLSQHGFPELNVLPRNLVPICHPCNHKKTTTPPVDENSSFIHPYYDRLPNERWLFAGLAIEENGPVLHYRVQLDPRHGALSQRLSFHFRELTLSERMRVHAATILREMEADINDFLEQLGPEGIKAHFLDSGGKSFARHGNTLEAAAYFAAAENDDYCSGRFRN